MNNPPASVVPVTHLSEQVAAVLQTELLSGQLAVGDRLPTEAALMAQFAVSRTVVREALSRLKSLGLVDSRQGSGVFVTESGFSPLYFSAKYAVSKQAVIQIAAVRRALDTEVAMLAAQRRSQADIDRIWQALDTLDHAVLTGGDGVDQDITFHRVIAETAGNPFLISTLQYLDQFLHGATRVTRANEARRLDFSEQARDEHEAIARAVEAGDIGAAAAAAAQHMNNAVERIEQAAPDFWHETGMQLARPLVAGIPSR